MNEGKYQAYPEYKETEVMGTSTVPTHWTTAELKRYSFVLSGYAFSSDSFVEVGEPVIRIGNIMQDGSVSLENCKCVSSEVANQYGQFIVRPGEVIMAMTGATIGKAGWFRGYNSALVNQRVGVFKCDQKHLNYRFFWHVLSSYGYQEHIKLTAFGGAQPNISDAGMVGYKAAIPPLSEQQQIAKFLYHETAKIDRLISKQQQLIELLKEKRQAVISHAVTKGLNPNAPLKPSGVEWLGDVPEHWIVNPVSFRYEIQLGKMLDTQKITGLHLKPYLRVADVQWGEINTIDLPEMDFDLDARLRFQLKRDDLLVNEGGSYPGRSALWKGELSECYYQKALHRVRAKNNNSDTTFYFYFVMRWATEYGVFEAGGNEATIEHLPAEKLRSYRFAFPPIDEQIELVIFLGSEINRFDTLESKAEKAITLLQERRTALISAAVRGKIDVRNWQAPEPSETQSEGAA